MWRAVKMLIVAGLAAAAAAMAGAAVARVIPPGAGNMLTTAAAAVAGLLFGLLYAWARSIPWHRLRLLAKVWQIQLARQLWWAMAGCISVAVLVLY